MPALAYTLDMNERTEGAYGVNETFVYLLFFLYAKGYANYNPLSAYSPRPWLPSSSRFLESSH